MGVAYGSLGAITTVPEPELRAGLDRFAAGDWAARRLPALAVDAPDGTVGWAINDIVVARKGSTQLIVEVSVAGELYARLAGDGIIIATPLGSSAYSMAAGGPLLSPDLNALVCTPLAMHGGCAPPLVVAGGQEVTLDAHPGHGGFDVEIDGFERASGWRAVHRQARAAIHDARRPGRGEHGTVRPAQPRTDRRQSARAVS